MITGRPPRSQSRPQSKSRSRSRSRLRPWTLAIALAILVIVMLVATLSGAAGLPASGVLRELVANVPFVRIDSGLSEVERSILVELRLPRVLLAALVGGLLAVAGAGYQGVFRNPLADPYLLGAAAGAGLGATLVIVYLPEGLDVAVPVAAFAGAVAGVFLAYLLGHMAGGGGTANLVLAGVAVASFLTAIMTFVQQSKIDELQRIFSWILGGVAGGEWHTLLVVLPYAALSSAVLLLHGRLLDALSVGDDEAAALGLSVARVRLIVLAAASLATASAVAVSGLIGFVGIVVPHLVRRLFGSSYRVVLPLSLLVGAAFLVLADLAARMVIAPAELPLGVVTAFVGAPFFIVVLRSTRNVGT